jgi:FAD/FMN-containing dehydrogenase
MNAPIPLTQLVRHAGPDAAELARRLRRHTQGEVLFDDASRGRYATDASIYQIMPVGVFVPTSDDDVATAIEIAGELGAPLLSRGGGTSQCGQTTGAALIIDHSKHRRRVLGVDAAAMTAEVEPGLVLDHLNAFLKPVLFLLTLPLQIITLGLFTLVINALLLKLADVLVASLTVDGFWPAFFGGLVISIVAGFLNLLFGGGSRTVEANVNTGQRQSAPSQPTNPPPGKGPIIDV